MKINKKIETIDESSKESNEIIRNTIISEKEIIQGNKKNNWFQKVDMEVKNYSNKLLENPELKDEILILEELYGTFPGDINDDVTDYECLEYINDGIRKIKWGKDAEGKIEQIIMKKNDIISRFRTNSSLEGHYFTDFYEDFESLQLPYSRDKYIKYDYIVLKEFPVLKSEIALQPWNSDKVKDGSVQYYSIMNEKDLIELGYIKKLNRYEGDK